RGSADTSTLQAATRRPVANAEGTKRAVHARHAKWTHQSPADFDGNRRRSFRELCPLAEKGMERRPLRWLPQTISAEWREPSVGVWLSRRIKSVRQGSAMV